jgi:hypothetical protein
MNKQANWGIEGLVKELRDIRVHSLETRARLDYLTEKPLLKF